MNTADNIRSFLLASTDSHVRLLGSADCLISKCCGFQGPGRAIFGWWSIGPAGGRTFIVRSLKELKDGAS